MSISLPDMLWLERPPTDYVDRLARLGRPGANLGDDLHALARHYLSPARLEKLGQRVARYQAEELDLSPLQTVRLGVVANSTTDFLAQALRSTGLRHRLNIELVVADFDQAAQESLDPAGLISTSSLDLVLMAIEHHGLNLDRAIGTPTAAVVEPALRQFRAMADNFAGHTGARVIVQTTPRPYQPVFGSFDRQVPGSWVQIMDAFNAGVTEYAQASGALLLDAAGLAETVGLSAWHDAAQWYSAKIPFAIDLLPLYADHVCRLIAAWKGMSRKCLVLDLDNTLWGGVIGDDGLDGIVLGQGDGAGEAFLAIQRTAKELSQRGIVLAVCSKNDEPNALEPFQKHPEMVLRRDDIAAFHANWSDKASNIRAIAQSLNLGLDSLVFLDDNPAEREQVRSALPEVAVPELPDDPALYPAILMCAGYFDAITFTKEDRERSAQYQTNARRTAAKIEGQSIEDYLRSLDMRITITAFDAVGRSRVTQLINKTNQFNLTTRRCDEAEVQRLMESPRFLTAQVTLVDKFGNNGMIACLVAEKNAETWELPLWLMSCRVLNRRVEEAVLNWIVARARAEGATTLIGFYRPTAKNGMVRDLYGRLGFRKVEETADGQSRWELDLASFVMAEVPFEFI